jgi:hypothetical protein
MNTQHTPGPWAVNDSTETDDDTTLTICAPADEVEIATMSAYENGCECFSEIRANAHLIAAAPVMYEALQHAAMSYHHPACSCKGEYASQPERYCTCHVQKARQALAQAEGKQS